MLLGRLLLGLAAAAVGAVAVAVTVKYVRAKLDLNRLSNLAQSEGIHDALIETVERCENKVTLKDLNSNKRVTYQGDSIAREVKEGIVI